MITTAILYFNKPTLTRRCLASVEAAGAGRVLLVDNGSKVPLAPGRTVHERLRLEPNQGFARGMNAALRHAFADRLTSRVVLLSNDIELPADFHATLAAEPAGREPELLCPHVYHLVDKSKPAYTHGSLDLTTHSLSHHYDSMLERIEFPRYYPAAATVWNRPAFERLGGFDERYFCYWEDVELSHRATRQGIALRLIPGLRVHHLGRGTTGGKAIYNEHFAEGQKLTLGLISADLLG